jgi:hypothetical protein
MQLAVLVATGEEAAAHITMRDAATLESIGRSIEPERGGRLPSAPRRMPASVERRVKVQRKAGMEESHFDDPGHES